MIGACLFCNVSLWTWRRNYHHNHILFLRCVAPCGLACIVSGILSLFGDLCRAFSLYIIYGGNPYIILGEVIFIFFGSRGGAKGVRGSHFFIFWRGGDFPR